MCQYFFLLIARPDAPVLYILVVARSGGAVKVERQCQEHSIGDPFYTVFLCDNSVASSQAITF
jgi:hypothetical protein